MDSTRTQEGPGLCRNAVISDSWVEVCLEPQDRSTVTLWDRRRSHAMSQTRKPRATGQHLDFLNRQKATVEEPGLAVHTYNSNTWS